MLAALHELRGSAWPKEKLLITMSVASFTGLVTCGMSAEEAHGVSSLDEAQAPMFYILHAAPLACALLAGSSWHTSAAFGLPRNAQDGRLEYAGFSFALCHTR